MLRFCLRLDEITYKEYAHSPSLAEPCLYPRSPLSFMRARIAVLMRRYSLKAEQLRTRSTRLPDFSESSSPSITLRASSY